MVIAAIAAAIAVSGGGDTGSTTQMVICRSYVTTGPYSICNLESLIISLGAADTYSPAALHCVAVTVCVRCTVYVVHYDGNFLL